MLMDKYPAPADGWVGFALPYHLVEGWWDEPEWVDPDPATAPLIIEQAMRSVDDLRVRAFAEALAWLYRAALEGGGEIVWQRE